MTEKELVEEIYGCLLEKQKERMSKQDVQLVVKLLFETVIQELMLGGSIIIRNFGRIEAAFTKGGNMVWCEPVKRMVRRKPNIKLKLIPARRLKSMVGRIRTKMRQDAKRAYGEENHGEVRVRTGKEGREGKGSSGKGEVPEVREQSEW